ncbi:class A beta-lactamase-related serine hydrolase [Rheinheimera sp. D18]|uniref:serine hydrolase domain-containing protein n=1 Tax=Rheinheimera sp. D18 TaxID=2545632 RepID=UPI00105091D9|nr:serine hydrolase domain-containing protein [Rheinheimera sp. D18]QBL09828.1 class A beta-lactamase-related serine hydrolase [Rheinheimera sp. D18]
MKPLFFIVLALAFNGFAQASDDDAIAQGENELAALIADFDQYYAGKLSEQDIPGGAYAIVQGNKIIATAGFGVREKGLPELVDANTVFRIASVSKTFAGGLTSILASEGNFNWDDKLVKYLPDFSFKTKKYNSQLTLEHLLSQSTGVMANAYDNLIEANVPLDKILPQFSKIDPLCNPGQCYGYQNVLFSLIDQVIQKTTKKTYAQLLEERIIKPLQLPTASVGLDGFFSTENRAMPHVRARGKWHPTKVAESYYHFSPAAGVNASAIDLGYWLIAQLGHNPKVLSEELLKTITKKRVKTRRDLRRKEWRRYLTDAHYALGWRVYQFGQDELIYHGGWVQGFRAEIAYSREHQLGLVMLMNAESNLINELGTYFWSGVLTAIHQQQQDKKDQLKANAD